MELETRAYGYIQLKKPIKERQAEGDVVSRTNLRALEKDHQAQKRRVAVGDQKKNQTDAGLVFARGPRGSEPNEVETAQRCSINFAGI